MGLLPKLEKKDEEEVEAEEKRKKRKKRSQMKTLRNSHCQSQQYDLEQREWILINLFWLIRVFSDC